MTNTNGLPEIQIICKRTSEWESEYKELNYDNHFIRLIKESDFDPKGLKEQNPVLVILPLSLEGFKSFNAAELIHLNNLSTRTLLCSSTNAPREYLTPLFDVLVRDNPSAQTMGNKIRAVLDPDSSYPRILDVKQLRDIYVLAIEAAGYMQQKPTLEHDGRSLYELIKSSQNAKDLLWKAWLIIILGALSYVEFSVVPVFTDVLVKLKWIGQNDTRLYWLGAILLLPVAIFARKYYKVGIDYFGKEKKMDWAILIVTISFIVVFIIWIKTTSVI